MAVIMEQIRDIQNIATALRKRELDFTQVPFEDIVNCIQSVYEQTMRKGEEFVLLYGGQITRGLENRDYDAVADILQILAYHFTMIEINERNLNRIYGDVVKLKCEREYFKNLLKLKNREEIQGTKEYKPFQGKGVVYSAITGEYDNVKEPKYINPDFDYILFTDNPDLKTRIWKVRLIDNPENLDNVRLSKRVKLLGHEYLAEYDYSVWVDGSMDIIGDVKEYIERYKRKEPMLNFNHHGSNCIYDEVKRCIKLRKDDGRIMDEQIERYRVEGYPAHYGMTANGMIVRDIHNETVNRVMELWWEEIKNGSYRDQLSFNYVCWKENFMYDTCDLYICNNKYVRVCAHNKK